MAKRNAKKQAARAELQDADPVCAKLARLTDEADLLILTQGADYDTENALAAEYDKRLTYLSVLLDELMEYRVLVLVAEESGTTIQHPDTQPSPEDPTAHEGSPDAADHEPETE